MQESTTENYRRSRVNDLMARREADIWVPRSNSADVTDQEDVDDDREQFEDFELVTNKFIVPINEKFSELLRVRLGDVYKYHMVFYKADWNNEKQAHGDDFIKTAKWNTHTLKMKGKFVCEMCELSDLFRNQSSLEKNYALKAKARKDGWTTANSTMQVLIKESGQAKGATISKKDLQQVLNEASDENKVSSEKLLTGLKNHSKLKNVPTAFLEELVDDVQPDTSSKDSKILNTLAKELNRKFQSCKILVRVYSQLCKRCNKVGDVGLYEDETERLAEVLSKTLIKQKFN